MSKTQEFKDLMFSVSCIDHRILELQQERERTLRRAEKVRYEITKELAHMDILHHANKLSW